MNYNSSLYFSYKLYNTITIYIYTYSLFYLNNSFQMWLYLFNYLFSFVKCHQIAYYCYRYICIIIFHSGIINRVEQDKLSFFSTQ